MNGHMIQGMRVHIVAPQPRMQCSPEFTRVMLSVGADELVRETNAWMREFFGTVDMVPTGRVLNLHDGQLLVMNQATFDMLKGAV